jgi:hypothetical protein
VNLHYGNIGGEMCYHYIFFFGATDVEGMAYEGIKLINSYVPPPPKE